MFGLGTPELAILLVLVVLLCMHRKISQFTRRFQKGFNNKLQDKMDAQQPAISVGKSEEA